ncbi:MAG: hypothetical protein N2V75_03905 [Methanophagales archaeon]|nr:hypothetical protein [Methanophagales archaeon]
MEKNKLLFKRELEAGLKHIRRAADLTDCSLCIKDLAFVELIIENLIQLIEGLQREKKEKKEERSREVNGSIRTR